MRWLLVEALADAVIVADPSGAKQDACDFAKGF